MAFEESARRVEDLRARRAQARRDAEEISKVIKKARERADTYRSLSAEEKQRAEQLKAAEAQYNEIKQRINIITTTEAKLSEARNAARALEEEIPLKVREKHEREKEGARTKAALEDARKGRQLVEQADELAETARRFIECRKVLSDLRALIAKVQQIETILSARKKERAVVIAPDAKTLRAIRKLTRDRDDARSKIDASLITLEVVPRSDGLLEVLAGERIGPQKLTAGAPTLVQGSPEIVADLPGVARLRARGPTGSIEEHREAKAKAEKKLAELTEPFGISDPDALDGLSEKARLLDEGLAESETQLATLLADRTLEEFVREQSAQESASARILEQYPGWEQSPPDLPALKSKAQEVKNLFISTVESAEAAWEVAQAALTAAAGQEETVTSRFEEARKLCASLESQHADLTKDGKQPQERQREIQQLAMAWEAAHGRLKEIEDCLAEFQDDPQAAFESLEAQLTRCRGNCNGSKRTRNSGRIEIGGSGSARPLFRARHSRRARCSVTAGGKG